MKKLGLVIFASALIVGLVVSNLFSFGRVKDKLFNFSFNIGKERGSGHMATEVREVSAFHAIEVGGVFQVEIVAGKEHGVEVEADDNLLQFIKTEVHRGVLEIETTRGIKSENPIRVRVTAQDIDDLEVSGAASVTLDGVKNGGLEVDSSGASKIKLSGETAKFVVDVSGATKVDGEGLISENATVEASGASHVKVNVIGNLRADTSGASSVVYSGTPKDIVKKTSGASSVSPR
jgi:hypothetical protein